MNTSRDKIKSALQRFSDGNLAENARHLLNVLGYHSQRIMDLEPNTADGFVEHFDPHNTMSRERGQLSKWESIDFLFQLTDEEITQNAQSTFHFEGNAADQNGFESYLFFALKLRNQAYTRTQLSNTTREINKLFTMPAMIIFQHAESLTFSVIDRQLNKLDKSEDGLEKITLIEHVDFGNPHVAHIDLLFSLSIAELYREHKFSNFPELHDAWEKTLDTPQLNSRFCKEIATWYFSADDQVSFPDGVDLADAWFQIGCSRSELTELKIKNSEDSLYTDENCELYDGTIAAYRKAIELQPQHARARKSLAKLFIHFAETQSEEVEFPSDHGRAIDWCKQATEICPDFAHAYYKLLWMYDLLMEYKEINEWDDYILMDQIGMMSFEIVEARIEVCQILTEIQPNDATAYYELGMAYLRSIGPLIELADEFGDETEDEIEAMKQAKHPEVTDTIEKAIKAYRTAINEKPYYAAAYNELAKAYQRLDRYEEAIQNFKQAIALGNLYCKDKARRRWEPHYIETTSLDFHELRERRIHRNLATAYHNLGKLNFVNGKYMHAIECYHNAVSVDSYYDAVYYDLAVANDEAGCYELAIVWYGHVRNTYEYPDVHYRLGKALHRIAWYDEAAEEYQKAIDRKVTIEEEYQKTIDRQVDIGYLKTHDIEPLQYPAWWDDVQQDLECAANNKPPYSS